MTDIRPADHAQRDARAFFRLRIAFGVIGLALPIVLAVAGLVADGEVQPTISDFFHTTQRDILVGGLVAIGVFLAVHRGIRPYPGRWISPDLLALLAGLAAIGVAFFPNESDTVATFSQRALGLEVSPAFHYASACMLYLMMSLTCFLVYAPDARGWERKVYLVAGAVIWTTGWNVMILSTIKNSGDGALAMFIQNHNIVYWDESLGVWAFSGSWILKAVLENRREVARLAALRRRNLGQGHPARAEGGAPVGPRPTTLDKMARWLRGGRAARQWSPAPAGGTPSFARQVPTPPTIRAGQRTRRDGRAQPAPSPAKRAQPRRRAS
ncbi:hypothetical protein GQE99_06215 [Maritimibacter sp. DP07]|uniref:DUF998 domain-containing protein n=1 Tax=Maritimibacter harenae TaxID=2606218 RepID=A0A845M573_9RHOB|nr:hypothetical protein [Maritimibacter harenae]MZR12613.1 hypothetical protein [Maritimibacter harenae]